MLQMCQKCWMRLLNELAARDITRHPHIEGRHFRSPFGRKTAIATKAADCDLVRQKRREQACARLQLFAFNDRLAGPRHCSLGC